ncbi:unnamed protein product [Effrenium voratum]|uniref:Uncharacterized protein n=1 Tax=Effrenium voratum TaxID=2562239 RepID=A0AA36I012_9DINO|nr:unnamed protein product [Effrenium voratum]
MGGDNPCDVSPVSKASQSSLDSPKRWRFLEQALICACATRSGQQMPSTPRTSDKSDMCEMQRAAWRSKSVPQIEEVNDEPKLRRKATVSSLLGQDEHSPRLSLVSGPGVDVCMSPRALLRPILGTSLLEVSSDLLCPKHEGQLEVFEHYEFISAVGSGAFGRVLRAKHRQGGQMRACKALTASTPLERKLVETEIAILKALNHPHVLQLHEVYFEPSTTERQRKVYLLTELCTGGDLLFRIAYHYQTLKCPMTEGHVAYQLRQLLSAAMYCHQRGIVHRDVKPDNVLFVDATASSPLKLIDLGLAGFAQQLRENAVEVSIPRSKSLGRLAKVLPRIGARWFHVRKQMMQRAGTAFYMAPEMINAGVYDQKADLFSIGAIMCEMLTGWHPFYTPNVDDAQSVQAKIIAPKPVSLPDELFGNISEGACDVCLRLLEKDPARRLSAAQALQHPWFLNPDMPTPYGSSDGVGAWIFEGLKQYASSNKLHQASLQLLAQELDEESVQELRETFLALDASGDGCLDADELMRAASAVDYALEPEEASRLVRQLRGGYREFTAALAGCKVRYTSEQLKRCFQKLSVCGLIRFQDMQVLLCNSISESEWEDIVRSCTAHEEAPTIKSTISLDSFLFMMQAEEASLPTSSSPVHVYGEEPAKEASPMEFWQRCTEPLCWLASNQ